MRCNVLNDHALDECNPIRGVDEVHAQMITDANVGDDCDITLIKGKAFAQDASTRSFQYCGIDIRMHQHVTGTAWPTAITGIDTALFNINAVRVCHAHTFAACPEYVGSQPYSRRFSICSCHGHDGDAGVVAFGEHCGDDRLAHRACLAERGTQMHAQTRRCIDFDDTSALLFHRLGDGLGDKVYPCDVETDHLCCRNNACG